MSNVNSDTDPPEARCVCECVCVGGGADSGEASHHSSYLCLVSPGRSDTRLTVVQRGRTESLSLRGEEGKLIWSRPGHREQWVEKWQVRVWKREGGADREGVAGEQRYAWLCFHGEVTATVRACAATSHWAALVINHLECFFILYLFATREFK